ncbi:MAG: TonB-dependent receptor plug domain-containing protein [Chitinophagaceae bacterium]|nr:TonB-dependent receptor plug domain-containing protein [Chitinophagaceae bacterium]
MSNNDNFFESFKAAAKEVEEQRFDGFEAVWQRVEQRLDEQPERRLLWYQRRPLWWAAAAAIALLLGLLLWPAADEQTPAAPVAMNPTTQPPAAAPVNPEPPVPPTDEIVTIQPKENSPQDKPAPANTVPRTMALAQQPATAVATAPPAAEMIAATPVAPTSTRPDSLRSGVVKDAQGKPLAGAMVRSSKATVITDAQGRYSLPVNAEADSIQYNLIGYEPTVLPTATAGNEVVLQPSASMLSDVVVVGYSRGKKKKEMTGSVTSVNQRNFQYSGSPAPTGLMGRAAGVQVNGNSGTPGAGSQVRIRGASSLKAGPEPLYVVNGVPVSKRAFAKLKPADIETVSWTKSCWGPAKSWRLIRPPYPHCPAPTNRMLRWKKTPSPRQVLSHSAPSLLM